MCYMVDIELTFEETDNFPKGLFHFTLPPSMHEGSGHSAILTNTWSGQSF